MQEIVVDKLESIESISLNGLRCTTMNQTIVDILDADGDQQIITECLANYYDLERSYDVLRIPPHLQQKFERYCEWAEEYYQE